MKNRFGSGFQTRNIIPKPYYKSSDKWGEYKEKTEAAKKAATRKYLINDEWITMDEILDRIDMSENLMRFWLKKI